MRTQFLTMSMFISVSLFCQVESIIQELIVSYNLEYSKNMLDSIYKTGSYFSWDEIEKIQSRNELISIKPIPVLYFDDSIFSYSYDTSIGEYLRCYTNDSTTLAGIAYANDSVVFELIASNITWHKDFFMKLKINPIDTRFFKKYNNQAFYIPQVNNFCVELNGEIYVKNDSIKNYIEPLEDYLKYTENWVSRLENIKFLMGDKKTMEELNVVKDIKREKIKVSKPILTPQKMPSYP